MILLGLKHIESFKKKHPNCTSSLDRTRNLLESLKVQKPFELKRVFGANVDFVGKKTVIDVAGNKARMILVISYRNGVGVIEAVLTHSEYDQNQWKD